MRPFKTARTVVPVLLAALMLLAGGCAPQESQASNPAGDPGQSGPAGDSGQSAAPSQENTRTPEESQPAESTEEPAQTRTLDFSQPAGVGNNLLNLTDGNDIFTFNGAFVSDGTYIYFSGSYAPKRLWRMKLDGSECEEYVQDMGGRIENFNLADGELYYSQKALIYALDLNTKEIRLVADSSGRDVEQLLVIGDRIYWTADGGVVMTTMRDGSSRPYFCSRANSDMGVAVVSELATDGEKLYYFAGEGTGTGAKLNIYELDLSVPLEDAEDKLTLISSTISRGSSSDVFYQENQNFFAFGANGFAMLKYYREEELWQYEAMFYDDIDGSLKTAPMTVLGTVHEEPEDGSFYWNDMAFPKFVLGNTMFGVDIGRHGSTGSTARNPQYLYMMPDMDTSAPTLVYTYSGYDLMSGGVFDGKLYLIEETDGVMKLTVIDRNGNIT